MRAPTDTLAVRVLARHAEADGVLRLELAAADGAALPPFEPGAHVDLHLANGLIRQYSLLNYQPAPALPLSYEIAVGLADASRGGSSHLHAAVAAGDLLSISPPRNSFALVADAPCYVFIAGGIGVTPIVSMIRWCAAHGKPWRLLYTVRSRKRAACLDALRALGGGRVVLHFDDENAGYADVAAFLAGCGADHAAFPVYCCGPQALMAAVERAALAQPRGALHFERFSAPAAAAHQPDQAFLLRLQRSGTAVRVAAGVSILDALEGEGLALPFGCREGLCRSCETAVCAGQPEHRDYVLSDQERAAGKTMMICVSRSLSAVLTLDI